MPSDPSFFRFLLIPVFVALGSYGGWEGLIWAAPASSNSGAKPPVVQPRPADRKVPSVPPKVSAKPSAKPGSNKALSAEPQRQSPSDRPSRKAARHRKAGKKGHPPAVVEQKKDLSYHGMFEQPQRYDPSRDRQTGRAPNPQAGELQYEHFQELDKNFDGMIDPFERAFGRLDMDRDVTNRQWE